jgi:hypothetical protein
VRDNILDGGERLIALHLARAAGLLLATITEIQGAFKFIGHSVNERIVEMWSHLQVFPEARELYDERYKVLMETTGMKEHETEPGAF